MICRPLILLAALATFAPHAPAAEPVKLAESARFDLMADDAARAIDDRLALEGAHRSPV